MTAVFSGPASVEGDMPYLLDCPACNHELQVPENLLGQLVRCPECAKTFTAPHEVQDVSQPRMQAPSTVVKPPPANTAPSLDKKEGFRCPYCQSQEKPIKSEQISVAGWIVFAVLMFTCLPLFWIGLLMKEEVRLCRDCGKKLSGGVL